MLAFDHLVIFAHSIDQAALAFENDYQLFTVLGGKHENWGTFNILAFMKNNSYIEWLGIHDLEKAKNADNPLIAQTTLANDKNFEGPIQFGLRTTSMDEFLSYYEKEGISYQGPFPGSRRRPDGSVLKWRMLFPKSNEFSGVLPFLIEWEGIGNQPEDLSKINPVSFTSILVGVENVNSDVIIFQKLYQLPSSNINHSNYEWKLENGRLVVSATDKKLEASFSHIHF